MPQQPNCARSSPFPNAAKPRYPGDFSYDALEKSDTRNKLFKAFKERKAIYCNMKRTAYYEISPVEPDKVLADFVAIFHPELMPKDYKPTFYKLLK